MEEIKKKRQIKPKAVVLDLDDTIVDFLGFLCSLHNKKNGTCIIPNDISEWNFTSLSVTDVRGNTVSGDELRNTFKEYEPEGMYVGLELIKDSDFALEIMKQLGYKIIILTARSSKFGKQTELNLIRNKIHKYIDEIYFKPETVKEGEDFKVNKIKELSKTYNVQLFADDRGETIRAVYENCNVNRVFLIEKPHNSGFEIVDDGIIKVKDLMETVRYLKEVK